MNGSCSDEEIAVFLPAVLQSLCWCRWEVSGVWAVRVGALVAFPRGEPDPVPGAEMSMAAFRLSRELGGSEHHGAHVVGIIWY